MTVVDVSAGARGLLSKYICIGVKAAIGRRKRGRELINFVSLAAVLLNTGFAVIYSLVDFANFRPLVIALLVFSVVWFPTPYMHRFGELAAGAYLWLTAAIGLSLYAWIAGADAGLQYFLLAGPAILVMVLGSRRLGLAALYFSIYLVVFAGIELFFPRTSGFIAMSQALTKATFLVSVCMAAIFNVAGAFYAFRMAESYEEAFEAEHDRSERLLLNLMPASIAERLKRASGQVIADDLPSVTILFADIVGFTARASSLSADRLVMFLNRIFLAFDRLAERHGLEKIKTIGDAYMVAGGIPVPTTGHARAVADLALDMLDATRHLSAEFGEEVVVRIGIHTGPAIAGVIGERRQFYDVWGDTVNVAARMESHSEPGRIQVSPEARDAIGNSYAFVERGLVDIKGKGLMNLYFLTGRVPAGAAAAGQPAMRDAPSPGDK